MEDAKTTRIQAKYLEGLYASHRLLIRSITSEKIQTDKIKAISGHKKVLLIKDYKHFVMTP